MLDESELNPNLPDIRTAIKLLQKQSPKIEPVSLPGVGPINPFEGLANEYKGTWIRFSKKYTTGKTDIWRVVNIETGTTIGYIKWFGTFRGYSFFPGVNTVYEKVCLREIAAFCEMLMEDRKKKPAVVYEVHIIAEELKTGKFPTDVASKMLQAWEEREPKVVSQEDEFQPGYIQGNYHFRDGVWLAAHVGCHLKFTVNGQYAEGMLDFHRTNGIFYLPFFGGRVNASLAMIQDHDGGK